MSEPIPAPYTVNDVAGALGKTPEWVARKASEGVIPSRKIGRTRRFTAEDIAAYLDRVREGGTNPQARTPRQQAARKRRPR